METMSFIFLIANCIFIAMIISSVLLYIWLGFIYKAPETLSWEEQRWGNIEKIRKRIRKCLYEIE